MSEKAIIKRIKDALISGVMEDIYKAERAYLLAKAIGEYAESVNASEYKSVLVLWQEMCSNEQTLAVARMFDRRNKKFPTRSIYVILELMDESAAELPVSQPHILFDTINIIQYRSEAPENIDCARLTQAVVKHFKDSMPIDALARLKESRDKVLAHNEAIENASRNYPTWQDANAAIAYAKSFVVTIGEGYFGIKGVSQSANGASGWEFPMQHLLRQLGLEAT